MTQQRIDEAEREAQWTGSLWAANAAERAHLESLGVRVHGEQQSVTGGVDFDVSLGNAAFNALDPFWGRYVWSLSQVVPS